MKSLEVPNSLMEKAELAVAVAVAAVVVEAGVSSGKTLSNS